MPEQTRASRDSKQFIQLRSFPDQDKVAKGPRTIATFHVSAALAALASASTVRSKACRTNCLESSMLTVSACASLNHETSRHMQHKRTNRKRAHPALVDHLTSTLSRKAARPPQRPAHREDRLTTGGMTSQPRIHMRICACFRARLGINCQDKLSFRGVGRCNKTLHTSWST